MHREQSRLLCGAKHSHRHRPVAADESATPVCHKRWRQQDGYFLLYTTRRRDRYIYIFVYIYIQMQLDKCTYIWRQDGYFTLYYAAQSWGVEAVRMLVDRNADVNLTPKVASTRPSGVARQWAQCGRELPASPQTWPRSRPPPLDLCDAQPLSRGSLPAALPPMAGRGDRRGEPGGTRVGT